MRDEPVSMVMLGILISLAQEESARISRRVKMGIAKKKKEAKKAIRFGPGVMLRWEPLKPLAMLEQPTEAKRKTSHSISWPTFTDVKERHLMEWQNSSMIKASPHDVVRVGPNNRSSVL